MSSYVVIKNSVRKYVAFELSACPFHIIETQSFYETIADNAMALSLE
jgi:hypothetical protein